jgi:hypothetical protein
MRIALLVLVACEAAPPTPSNIGPRPEPVAHSEHDGFIDITPDRVTVGTRRSAPFEATWSLDTHTVIAQRLARALGPVRDRSWPARSTCNDPEPGWVPRLIVRREPPRPGDILAIVDGGAEIQSLAIARLLGRPIALARRTGGKPVPLGLRVCAAEAWALRPSTVDIAAWPAGVHVHSGAGVPEHRVHQTRRAERDATAEELREAMREAAFEQPIEAVRIWIAGLEISLLLVAIEAAFDEGAREVTVEIGVRETPAPTLVATSDSSNRIVRVLEQDAAECYARAAYAQPDLAGQVPVKVTLRAQRLAIELGDTANPVFAACLHERITTKRILLQDATAAATITLRR